MARSRNLTDVADTRAKLDHLTAAVHCEAEGAEADAFDDAMASALAGVAEALKAEAGTLADFGAQLARLARRARTTE